MNAEQTHTPGPWFWYVNLATKSFSLRAAVHPFGSIVMDFQRYGMQGAQPRFIDNHIMRPATELTVVDPKREHHKDWHQLLEHPDARLIAAAPDLLAACRQILVAVEQSPISEEMPVNLQLLRNAIAKATIPTPQ